MSHRPSRVPAFLAELKRRKVFRVAAVYGVVAFVVLQVGDLVFPALLIPEWGYRLLAAFLFLGFPVALVLAWAFETTPGGLARTDPADTGEIAAIVAQPRSRRWPSGIFALVGILCLVAAAVLVFRRGSEGGRTSEGVRSSDENAAADAGNVPGGAGVDRGTPGDVRAVPPRSVAVIPFDNMSGDDTSAVFTAGVHDDILTQLSKIAGLQVTSRTSVKEYEGTAKSIPDIGQELGVANVLEGGVRRAGNRVRINVQLIDAATDEHLWAETFDRELTAENVFAIQGEIAAAVARALEAELTPEQAGRVREAGTRDLAALEAYYRGLSLAEWGLDQERTRRAIVEFERAVTLDPGFAAAWGLLLRSQTWLLRSGASADTVPARTSLDRLLTYAPDAPETHLAACYYQYYARGDYQQALAEFEAAERAAPGSAEAVEALSYIHRRLGHWQQSIDYGLRAMELDPRNHLLPAQMGYTFAAKHDYETAERYFTQGLLMRPDQRDLTLFHLTSLTWGLADTAAARAHLLDTESVLGPERSAVTRADLALIGRDFGSGIAILEPLGAEEVTSVLEFPSASNFGGDNRTLRLAKLYRLAGDTVRGRMYADSLERQAREAIRARRARGVTGRLFGAEAIAHSMLGMALALQGKEAEAVAEGTLAVQQFNHDMDAMDGTATEAYLAEILTLVGDHERAIAELDALLSRPSELWSGRLRLDPIFDPLRDDPRFARLAARE